MLPINPIKTPTANIIGINNGPDSGYSTIKPFTPKMHKTGQLINPIITLTLLLISKTSSRNYQLPKNRFYKCYALHSVQVDQWVFCVLSLIQILQGIKQFVFQAKSLSAKTNNKRISSKRHHIIPMLFKSIGSKSKNNSYFL